MNDNIIPSADSPQRRFLRVTGIVQGVGFRPFVYGLAIHHGLWGWVGNDSQGVFIEVQGWPAALEAFQRDLIDKAPPLAHIESITVQLLPLQQASGFHIVASTTQTGAATLISPDLSLCDDCLRELFDPADRRYRYPFINCTNCGSRFTIIQDIPYDRPFTTMRDFEMCPQCTEEYHDPLNRRFHAQPNACPICGPQIEYRDSSEIAVYGEAALQHCLSALAAGKIVAIKGLGGFHLACDGRSSAAVARLRQRKHRPGKPLAVMVEDLAVAQTLVEISPAEEGLLTSRERPIVLLNKRDDIARFLAPEIAPDNPRLGLMLPYTPLHYLLLRDWGGPLVMTSGNLSGAPIVTDNDEAIAQLGHIADGFLCHNRQIHVPCDDSVVQVVPLSQPREIPVRRSRGYAPFPVKLPFALPPILAVGGELKNTFCLTRDSHALMSQHIGDMANLETLQAFERAFDHMRHLFRVNPQIVACDSHPDYLSTRWAEAYAQHHDLPLIRVQHHLAHIAAAMAEHKLERDAQVIGFSFDGTGYGSDGAIWGGEVFVGGYSHLQRVAHLRYVPLPGGDLSIQKPYRMALAWLWQAGLAWDEDLPPVQVSFPEEQAILHQQLTRGVNSAPTSSMGRLFDAVSALLGIRQVVSYEAQAAIELEGVADNAQESTAYRFDILREGEMMLFDPAPLLRALITDKRAGLPVTHLAACFHTAVAELVMTLAQELHQTTGIRDVVLSGGVFQNMRLLTQAIDLLQREGFHVLIHHQVPPNDGGLALGQAVLAWQRWL